MGGNLVTVDANPTGAVLSWRPGLNSQDCRGQLTTMDRLAAQELANAIRTASAFPHGPSSCPSDDGTDVTAYFTYPAPTDAEVVTLHLTGCAMITAPGHWPRQMTTAVIGDLKPFAPSAWAKYVSG